MGCSPLHSSEFFTPPVPLMWGELALWYMLLDYVENDISYTFEMVVKLISSAYSHGRVSTFKGKLECFFHCLPVCFGIVVATLLLQWCSIKLYSCKNRVVVSANRLEMQEGIIVYDGISKTTRHEDIVWAGFILGVACLECRCHLWKYHGKVMLSSQSEEVICHCKVAWGKEVAVVHYIPHWTVPVDVT